MSEVIPEDEDRGGDGATKAASARRRREPENALDEEGGSGADDATIRNGASLMGVTLRSSGGLLQGDLLSEPFELGGEVSDVSLGSRRAK
jgi:hypothetical protein